MQACCTSVRTKKNKEGTAAYFLSTSFTSSTCQHDIIITIIIIIAIIILSLSHSVPECDSFMVLDEVRHTKHKQTKKLKGYIFNNDINHIYEYRVQGWRVIAAIVGIIFITPF